MRQNVEQPQARPRADVRSRSATHRLHRVLAWGVLLFAAGVTGASATDFTGTWHGVLTSAGQSGDVEVIFSEAGHPLYTYTNNQGVTRQVELTRSGQKIEYVPAGGGVQTVVVESIQQQPASVVLSLSGSFERAKNGYLDQRQEMTTIEYRLVPQGLHMRVTLRAVSHLSDKDLSVGGTPDASVAEGILQKVK
jgi:hypothetical protein